MAAETGPPRAESEEDASRVPRWIVAAAVLGGIAVAIGAILYYGYTTRAGWVGVSGKKFWDYLELLIVPAALAIGVAWLRWEQGKREREAALAQQEHERVAEEVRKDRELQIDSQRAQDEALQAYLNQMSQLLIDKERPLHRAVRGDELSAVVRAWTLVVLDTLDSSRLKGLEAFDSGRRKRRVVKFLYEAKLIRADCAIVSLSKGNLSGADLSEADLSGADLSGADLRGADLSEAILNGAVLKGARLGTVRVSVVLPDGDTEPAESHPADLRQADLSQANLQWAQGCTHEQLDQAQSLEGATMPDGRQYDDWVERGWLRHRSGNSP